jgi:hypothetical protein
MTINPWLTNVERAIVSAGFQLRGDDLAGQAQLKGLIFSTFLMNVALRMLAGKIIRA